MKALQVTNDKINTHGGLILVGKLLAKNETLSKLFSESQSTRSDRISDADILTTQIGLLAQGRTHYQDVELFRQDHGESFSTALMLDKIPSEATLRQRLGALATTQTMQKLEGVNLSLIKSHHLSPIELHGRHYIPNDIDVTPMDNTGSNREHVGRTYKGCDGFAPIMSNIGREGFLIHHELRPGTQHCQKDTPEFLRRNFELINKLKLPHPVLIRMDAGNDSADTVMECRKSKHHFLIKRNQRRENPVTWLSHAMSQGSPEIPRVGKEVYTGSVEHLVPGGKDCTQSPVTCIYRVTKRSIDKYGHPLLIDDIEVETYWTNLAEAPEDVIALYHDHGTSEQFHSELKSDIGIERMPSESFARNKLFLALGSIAYNILRAIDQRAMKLSEKWPRHFRKRGEKQQRRRAGSIIRDFITVAAKSVSHSGRKVIKIARGWPWTPVIVSIHKQLA